MTNVSPISAASGVAVAIVEPARLRAALAAIGTVIEKRNAAPILGTIAISAEGSDRLLLRATDQDIDIAVSVVADAVDSRFGMCVDAKPFMDTLKKNKATSLATLSMQLREVAEDDKDRQASLDMQLGALDTKIAGYVLQDFISMKPADGPAHSITISGSTLHSGLDRTRGAVSTEETRYYLNGVFLHQHDRDMVFVSTDGNRLYRQCFEIPGVRGMPGVIVPRKLVNVVHALTKGRHCPATVDIKIQGDKIRFTIGDAVVIGKLIDGTFPDYNRVVPAANPMRAIMDSEVLADAVVAVTAMRDGPCAAKLVFENGRVTLSTREAGGGSAATSTVSCKTVGETSMEIGFGARYLRDVIATACPAGEPITFEMSDPGSPTRIVGTSPRFYAVLMPMRV